MDSPLPPPRKRSRSLTEKMADKGTDTTARGQRKAAGRQRKPAVAYKNHAVKLSADESEVIYTMCDTFDVGLSRILRRFVQDAIRKYAKDTGHPEWIEDAGLAPKTERNPFDEMESQPEAPQQPTYPIEIWPAQHPSAYQPVPSVIPSDVVLPGGVGFVPQAAGDE